MKILKHVKDIIQGKAEPGRIRSDHWPAVRKAHLAKFPACFVCDGKKKLEVHHKKPFHLHPELELDPNNLITLCESKENGVNCHLFVGHLGNFHSFNVNVDSDGFDWNQKLKNRPLGQIGEEK